jgi:hypothetical protein
VSETPRHLHTTLRYLSHIVSRGETEIRAHERACRERFYYNPKLTDAQVADHTRKAKEIRARLEPYRKALAALAAAIWSN